MGVSKQYVFSLETTMMDPTSPPQLKYWSSFLKKMISISPLQHVMLMASQPTNPLMGTQLDCEGNTTDPDKELQNLRKTENLLPDIWPNAIIDGYLASAYGFICQKKPVMSRNLLIINWNHGLEKMFKVSNTASKFLKAQMTNDANLWGRMFMTYLIADFIPRQSF